jgi:hypothetical protein
MNGVSLLFLMIIFIQINSLLDQPSKMGILHSQPEPAPAPEPEAPFTVTLYPPFSRVYLVDLSPKNHTTTTNTTTSTSSINLLSTTNHTTTTTSSSSSTNLLSSNPKRDTHTFILILIPLGVILLTVFLALLFKYGDYRVQKRRRAQRKRRYEVAGRITAIAVEEERVEGDGRMGIFRQQMRGRGTKQGDRIGAARIFNQRTTTNEQSEAAPATLNRNENESQNNPPELALSLSPSTTSTTSTSTSTTTTRSIRPIRTDLELEVVEELHTALRQAFVLVPSAGAIQPTSLSNAASVENLEMTGSGTPPPDYEAQGLGPVGGDSGTGVNGGEGSELREGDDDLLAYPPPLYTGYERR